MDGEKKPISWLRENITKLNIAAELDESVVAKIGPEVVYGYNVDEQSRAEWMERTQYGLKNALQKQEEKTDPWPRCANVLHPVIAAVSIQFAARAYPSIVKGTKVVKCQVVGRDLDGGKTARAKRVSEHMSYQLLNQMTEWEEGTDRLLHVVPVMGMSYRKTYWDETLRRARSEMRTATQVCVNNWATDLATARRITDQVALTKNEVVERERAGIFTEGSTEAFAGDEQEKHAEIYLEQHGWYDLDGDGYEEPYIFTVHYPSSKLVRIVARYEEAGIAEKNGKVLKIEPLQYFVKYPFIPSPDGSFHDLGFAQLLGPINETTNTIINQLLDAGSMTNQPAGFLGRGARLPGGRQYFRPGEWKQVDVAGGVLRDNIVPLPSSNPSPVLFQLLGFMGEAARSLSSVSEVMTGDHPGGNVPATTVLAMIEQGMKVFTAIYKRIYRSLASEFRLLYRLNSLYLEEEDYYRVLDDEHAISRGDYKVGDHDVFPVADPTISSDAQRYARTAALMEAWERVPFASGKLEILRRHFENLDITDIEKILPPDEIKNFLTKGAPPNPDLLRLELDGLKQKHDYEHEHERMRRDGMKLQLEVEKLQAEIDVLRTQAVKNVAEAEAKEAGDQFAHYQAEVEMHRKLAETALRAKEIESRGQERGRVQVSTGSAVPGGGGSPGGVAAPPGDEVVPPVPSGSLPGGGESAGERVNPDLPISASDSAGNEPHSGPSGDVEGTGVLAENASSNEQLEPEEAS